MSWTWALEPSSLSCNSRREHYEIRLPASAFYPKTGEHLITVRVYDRHDNVGVAKTVFTAPAK